MSENPMDAVDRRLRAVAVSVVTDAYFDDWAAVDAIMRQTVEESGDPEVTVGLQHALIRAVAEIARMALVERPIDSKEWLSELQGRYADPA